MAEFSDHKEAGALRTIGEVAGATGIKTHVLRYWEQQFPQLKPLKRSGGRRYYRPEDVALVARIDQLVNRDGYTLKGAKAALRGVPDQQAAAQDASSRGAIGGDVLAKLKAIRADLKSALSA
ncbi:MerR family transcriptional regulator [Qipengyuania vesicularis]|uniref:MerR family transcriptional regulator n=1 Tax=Qipengyuania vesicularis TaxID=2867232 RepID=UPI001C868556|nr:MerR family transcriptional regulator [Qipengyuania vesicularis]MBX7527281.1 MerR family transcriptional regulator [Qipengyuania vesicularis]